ncbi:MAG: dUTPase [Eubacteriales bacterium]|nr:dUTPase [Eubacteriales bacterium]
MDKLDKIFEMQSFLDEKIARERNLKFSKEEWIQKEVLAMISELSEVLDEVNFKWWKNKKEINDDQLKEEIVDLLHFLISMSLKAGMSAEEIFSIYMKKNEENIKRQEGKTEKEGYLPLPD